MSAKTTVNYAVELGASMQMQMKIDHRINKNLKVGVHQSLDKGSGSRDAYDLGFDVAYQL